MEELAAVSDYYCQTCRMQVGYEHFGLYHPTPPYDDGNTYTLTQAAREIAKQECRYHGHTWDVVETFGGSPAEVVCTRCGESHAVAAKGSQP